MIGKTLSHYQVVEKLGEGGMGVVYRALDTRLNRSVAVKVLLREAMADTERGRRFVQEARAASALNHPNIITVYDVGEATPLGPDAPGQSPVSFLVMEYVAGRTLDQTIGRKGLKLGEALKYAVQIADALATAHAAGIVHRDLKPANVMITDKGLVKVLDFGLAKLTEPVDMDGVTATRTANVEAAPQTEEGTILGTVAYMSPEQAEGKKVDARSDIFSFGSLLYEMVTGRRAFHAETKVATLSAILHKEPRPVSEIAEGIPRELDRIIAHCLRKDPARRFQHLDDVKTLLEELKDESDSGRLVSQSPPAAAPVRWTRQMALVGGIVAVAAVVAIVIMQRSRPSATPPPIRLTSDSGLTTDPALSPDGKLLAFASDRGGGDSLDIWVKQVGGADALRLTTHAADDYEPDFSPDGQRIAFRSDRDGGGIYLVSTLGADARRIAEAGRRPRFSPDGKWIAYWVGEVGDTIIASEVYIVPSSGGAARPVQTNVISTRDPVWSPDGTRLLLYGLSEFKGPGAKTDDWWVVPVEGGPAIKTGVFALFRRQKMTPGSNTSRYGFTPMQVPSAWTADNRIVFSGAIGDSTNIWQVSISPQTYQVTGDPERLTGGTGIEVFPALASGPGGPLRMAFASMNENIDVWSLPFQADSGANQGKVTGELRRLTQDAAPDASPGLTRDGKTLVFQSSRLGNFDIWTKDLDSGKETALASTPLHEWHPAVSADGSTLAYQVVENQKETIHVSVHGGPARKVCDDCYLPWDLSSDGTKMLYWQTGQQRVGLLDVASGAKTDLLQHPEYTIIRSSFSPDDRWIVFIAIDKAGRTGMFIVPFRGSTVQGMSEWIAITDNAWFNNVPRWSPDGNLIYFSSNRDGFLCLWAQRLDPATKKPVESAFPVQHFHSARRSHGNVATFFQATAVATDKLVFPLNERTANIWMIER